MKPRFLASTVLLVVFAASIGGADPSVVHAARPVSADDQGVLRWKDTGEEIALFGVNYYAPHVFDYDNLRKLGLSIEDTIDRDLAHFVRMGLDAMRLHVFDREISDPDGNLIDNDHLRLLDYLIAHAKERGIYTVLTPIAWWPGLTPNSGFSNRFTMPQMMTDSAAWKAQCRYLTQFLNHVNPLTHMAIKDDPAVPVLELINEPQYPPDITDSKIVEYVNTLAEAVRGTGCTKPIFYNGWGDRYAAVRDANIQGSTFGWYPSGLCALRSLGDNFLPRVSEYAPMHDAAMAKKAKIVYEFDAADIPTSYIYPAIARSFRAGGAQIATQFQYDPLPLAPYNVGWQTHYLNLVYAPNKAVSFIIACEAFHTLPRGQSYGAYPENNRFGAFRVSYEEGLSEMATERAFLYSNDTKTVPPAPEHLERIVGCGSSPIVHYDGTGAYFLDKLAPGSWRLEVYPDAVWVADPYGQPSLDREVSRVLRKTLFMTIHLPDLGDTFSIEPLNEGNTYRADALVSNFFVLPGVYALKRPDAEEGTFQHRLGLREFVAPEESSKPDVVRHDPVKTWVSGKPLPVNATVVGSPPPELVRLHYRLPGSERFENVIMRRHGFYQYSANIPAMGAGILLYYIGLYYDSDCFIFPRPEARAFPANIPMGRMAERTGASRFRELFVAARENSGMEIVPDASSVNVETVDGGTPGHYALRLSAEGFADGKCGGVKVPTSPLPAFKAGLCPEVWNQDATLVVRARNLRPQTTAVEVGLIEEDGSAHGQDAVLTPAWRDVRIPFRKLRTLWGTRDAAVNVERIAKVSVLFGAWQFGKDATLPHGLEIESVRIEPAACCWEVAVLPSGTPISLFDGECSSINVGGVVNYTQRQVAGMSPDRLAFRLMCPDGFGPPPSCIGLRQSMAEDVRMRHGALTACTTLCIRARAATPATTAVELTLIELDDTPWGINVPLTSEWREITIPLSELHHMAQWKTGPPNRGTADDGLRPENLAAINLCFGAWLFPDHAAESHGIEIESATLR